MQKVTFQKVHVDFKALLKSWITESPESVFKDCNTIQKARQEGWARGNFGGGNFLIGIGLFAVAAYLAKIYVFISNLNNEGFKLVSKEDVIKAKKWLRRNQEELKSLDISYVLICKPVNCINETEAFVDTIANYENECNRELGVKKSDLHLIWKIFRNKLLHYARPGREGTVLAFESINFSFAQPEGKVFERVGNHFNCNVDILKDETKLISEWISSKVDALTDVGAGRAVLFIQSSLTTDC